MLGFAHSSISLDLRIHRHESKHPWLYFGSFLYVLIQFRRPLQTQVRINVRIVLDQLRVFEGMLEAAGQDKAGRSLKLSYLLPAPPNHPDQTIRVFRIVLWVVSLGVL